MQASFIGIIFPGIPHGATENSIIFGLNRKKTLLIYLQGFDEIFTFKAHRILIKRINCYARCYEVAIG